MFHHLVHFAKEILAPVLLTADHTMEAEDDLWKFQHKRKKKQTKQIKNDTIEKLNKLIEMESDAVNLKGKLN